LKNRKKLQRCLWGPTKYRTGPHWIPKLGEGSPQPCQTMGSPNTLPLMGTHPYFRHWPPIQSQGSKRQLSPYRIGPQNPRKLPHRTPRNFRRGLPSHV